MKRSSQQILDEWLVTCAQTGDRKAFERLVQRRRPRLTAYAARQVNDKDGARDVVQECLLTVSRDIRKLKDPIAFPKWIYQILHRRACDWIRQQQRHRENDNAVAENFDDGLDAGVDPLLHQGLQKLEREHYLTLYFFYLEEFSLHEISVIMDVPLGTVKSRLFKARQKLKDYLEGGSHA